MKKILAVKHFTAAVIMFAVIFSFSAVFSAQTVYKTLIELPTENSSGWKAESSVTVSSETVKKGEKNAVSFTSNGQTVGGEYKFTAQWGEFSAEVSEIVLKTDIFISDISILKNGVIVLSTEDGHAFSWDIAELSLKSGWNGITLNLRTADTVRPPEQEEEDVSEGEESEGTETETEEEEQKTELTADEILLSVNKFAFEAKKTQAKELTVAFSGLSVSVPTKEEPPEPPKPITDEADQSLVIAAMVIAVLLIVAVFIYSAYSAKKEIKRRKREAKKRKLEKQQEEQKNEE